jgi:molecular chaperone HscB
LLFRARAVMMGGVALLAPTYFDLLGLPTHYALDAAEVERNYLARNRAAHPDYHQQTSTAQQRVSMEMTAALNEAYATLKHPFRRAEYLLGLHGGPTAAEAKEMAPAFLEEMLELRMEIEELRGEAPDAPARAAMEKQLRQRNDALAADLGRRFVDLEMLPADDAQRPRVLLQIRQLLNAAKYVQNLLRDLRAD